MITAVPHSDHRLLDSLAALTEQDKDYWSFRGNSRRDHGHGLLQYPAMMVPQVVRAILEQACDVHPEISRVGDPFAGSGTVLTESMLRGLSFSGTDINPLAILLCKVKSGPFFIGSLRDKADMLFGRLDSDRRSQVEVDFTNRDKWFRPDVQVALSKIMRAIRLEDSLWARRFFWIGMAEAVRFSCNSRTSTFKLHVRHEDDIDTRDFNPIKVFTAAVTRNLKHMANQTDHLNDIGLLNHGHYQGKVNLRLGDIRVSGESPLCDIIVTSPPYGDNTTTVPYGQYSYLPLQWIDLCDIDSQATADFLRTTHEIDSRSLGGKQRISDNDRTALKRRSPALTRYLTRLNDQPADRARRVVAFFRDLDRCLDPILSTLRPGGLMVWTLGNRKVGGKRVPLDTILSELLSAHNAQLLCKLTRRIHSKRMAPKNNVAATMSTEAILVMRKAG